NYNATNAITNGYGIYVDDSSPGSGGITNDYAIYTKGTEKNSLGGPLEFRGSSGGATTWSAGSTPATITYTLPTAAPASNGYVLASTTGGTLSWAVNGGGSGVSTIQTLSADTPGSATGSTLTFLGGTGII